MRIPEERAMRLHVNGVPMVTLMATPTHLRELCYGHLLNRGLIHSLKDIRALYACPEEENYYVELNAAPEIHESSFVSSACGQRPVIDSETVSITDSVFTSTIEQCQYEMQQLLKKNQHEDRTGGIHAASLSDGTQFFYVEDIGRHNAQDKVCGMALEHDVDFSKSILMTTGRISGDMVAKAIYAGIPILGSLSIPTTYGVSLASDYRICLVARVAKKEPTTFGATWRIIN